MLSSRTKLSLGVVDHELELVLGFIFVLETNNYLGCAKFFTFL